MNDKISVVINTYNAERHLDAVLRQVKAFDEIVICDMESTDSTLEIARAYSCKVETFPKGNIRICEPARNFAIHSASNDWVLVVDADELVPDTLRDYLYAKISDRSFSDAIAIPRINTFMSVQFDRQTDYQIRFFRKDRTSWPPTIHSHPIIDGHIVKLPAKRELSLIHLDNPSIEQRVQKMNTYTDYDMANRALKKYGCGKMLFRPFWFFFRSLILQGGIRHGRRGIANAYMSVIYQMVLLAKIVEKQLDTDCKK